MFIFICGTFALCGLVIFKHEAKEAGRVDLSAPGISVRAVLGMIMLAGAFTAIIIAYVSIKEPIDRIETEARRMAVVPLMGKTYYTAKVRLIYEDGDFKKIDLINGTIAPFTNMTGK